ncbi:hypothetical protein K60_013760 [Mycobacterium tuberculosis variant bovis BCG str. Korea 1168P]|uniref:Uncharacterized protein n=4 Tax=Mycobacterium tuberculosis TaxID=1773 RepID=Q8VK42_MYCTO|nr:hypothetical protein MT1321 [Mycobacterium tuberculosis CDC1551]AFE16216.1 hypothetical protein MRGA327_08040 [Mycobacterium tuberculosis RGTB327]AGE67286.1 hypothetical protein K60_013760 [Mycobacterium tuberculosis variant bovis BCG str. Korea 1168P]AGL22980.1 hypothetical protein I917_09105 [Mycobacterium tuberculosis str. Haarlem/NITR202]AGL26768.1 hypothetical protein J113_08970 [Mycobacterium tuberculosis CAS/NITR204]AGL30748.1 hypothetical protein J114_06915 [Mycobacterium tuberculos
MPNHRVALGQGSEPGDGVPPARRLMGSPVIRMVPLGPILMRENWVTGC